MSMRDDGPREIEWEDRPIDPEEVEQEREYAYQEHESDLRDWDDLLLEDAEVEALDYEIERAELAAEAWLSQWDDDPSPYSGDYSEE